MKSLVGRLAVLAILLMLHSCEPAVPVLKPGSYLPAYPGSYWKYIDSDGYTSGDFIEPYILDEDQYGNQYLVPVYHGKPLWVYSLHITKYPYGGSGSYTPAFTTLLKDDIPVGYGWSTGYLTPPSITTSYKIVAKDTTIVIGTNTYYPTIVAERKVSVLSKPTDRFYYTKDIGLVKTEHYLISNLDSIYRTVYLYDYHIGNY